MSQFIDRVLSNRLRVILEPMPHVPSAACGFMVRTGARDETPEEEGVSHFLEHMCFKGTNRRNWQDINQTFDRLGSTYNAFTSDEKTFYYGWVPEANLGPQIELIADMMTSRIPPKEFETEKKVILEEIAMYRDSLESCMFELAGKKLFAGTPLERSVIGTADTIGPLTRDQMVGYQQRRYRPDNIVFIATGRIDADAVLRQVESATAEWAPGSTGREAAHPNLPTGVATQVNDKFTQQALMLCYPAPPGRALDARVNVMSQILADDNSRIFWDVIQAGVCPRAGAFYMDYSDAGVFVLYALCEPERADRALAALREQAEKLTHEGPTDFEVQRVKNATRTSIAREGDAPMSRLVQLADDLDLVNRPLTLDEHMAKVEHVGVQDVRTLLDEYPITGEGMLVSVGPAQWPG